MATSSDESIIATCDNDDSSSEVIDFQAQSTPVSLCTFNEDRTVTVRGKLWRSGALELKGSGTPAEVLALTKGSTKRLEFVYDSTNDRSIIRTPAASDDAICLKSGGDVDVYIDFDDDADEQDFEILDRTSGGSPCTVFHMGWSYSGGYHGGASYLQRCGETYDERFGFIHVGNTNTVEGNVGRDVGGGESRRAVIEIWHDDSSGSERAGILEFKDKDGSSWYLWVDQAGKLRIHDSDPTADNDGDVVGDQC